MGCAACEQDQHRLGNCLGEFQGAIARARAVGRCSGRNERADQPPSSRHSQADGDEDSTLALRPTCARPFSSLTFRPHLPIRGVKTRLRSHQMSALGRKQLESVVLRGRWQLDATSPQSPSSAPSSDKCWPQARNDSDAGAAACCTSNMPPRYCFVQPCLRLGERADVRRCCKEIWSGALARRGFPRGGLVLTTADHNRSSVHFGLHRRIDEIFGEC